MHHIAKATEQKETKAVLCSKHVPDEKAEPSGIAVGESAAVVRKAKVKLALPAALAR